MKLIYSPASPFVRKVAVYTHLGNLTDKIRFTPVATTALNVADDARSANPLGKIPALILDDNSTLFDSRVICRYLDDLAGLGMYPADNIWKVLTLEALGDGIMDSGVTISYEKRLRLENEQSPSWIEAQWSKVEHAIASLETGAYAELQGPLNAGQISVACALDYIDFRHGDRDWRSRHPKMAEWQAKMQAMDAFKQTMPEG